MRKEERANARNQHCRSCRTNAEKDARKEMLRLVTSIVVHMGRQSNPQAIKILYKPASALIWLD